jgi:hypothetical protein
MFHPIDIHESVQEIFLDAQTLLMDRAWAASAKRAEDAKEKARADARDRRLRQLARPRWAWHPEKGWYTK